jgi:nitrate/nitrite transporter NarK
MTLAGPGKSAVFGVRASTSVGLPLGVALGGWLSTHLGDARTFATALAAMALATALAWWWLPSSEVQAVRRPDSQTTLALESRVWALGLLNFAVTFSALGVVLTTVTLAVATSHLSSGGLDSKSTASALLGSMVVMMGASTLAVGRVFKALAARLTATTVAVVVLSASLALLAVSNTRWGLVAGVGLVGASAGALSALVLAVLGELVVAGQTGKGVGLVQFCGDVGGVLGPVVASWLLSAGAPAPFAVSSAVVALVMPVSLWLRARRPASGLACHQPVESPP